MDLYQTLKYYNPMWSKREIVCFCIIVFVAGLLLSRAVQIRRLSISQAVGSLLLLLFLGIVFGSTVFTRETSERCYELTLFWSWREIYINHSHVALKEIVLNCILLMPMGLLLPVIAGHRVFPLKGFAAGFFASAIIEICQLVFKRGLFEWDDMIHNALGCMMGCCLMNLLVKIYLRIKMYRRT